MKLFILIDKLQKIALFQKYISITLFLQILLVFLGKKVKFMLTLFYLINKQYYICGFQCLNALHIIYINQIPQVTGPSCGKGFQLHSVVSFTFPLSLKNNAPLDSKKHTSVLNILWVKKVHRHETLIH